MSSKIMQPMLAKIPQSVRDQVALERRVFKSDKSASSAAAKFLATHPDSKDPITVTSRVAHSLHKRTALIPRNGRLAFGGALFFHMEATT